MSKKLIKKGDCFMKVKLNENNEDHASEKVLPSIISHKLESPTEQELIEPMEFFDPKTKPIVPMAFYEGKGKGEDAQRQQDNSIVDSWNEVVPSTNKSTTNFKLYPPKHIENISNVAEKSNQRFKVNAYNTEQELLQKQNLLLPCNLNQISGVWSFLWNMLQTNFLKKLKTSISFVLSTI